MDILSAFTEVIHGAIGGQKTALDPLELQLHLVVSCHTDSENLTQVS